VKRDEWIFIGHLALVGFLFPLVWALLVPIALELWRDSKSPDDQPVDPGLALLAE